MGLHAFTLFCIVHLKMCSFLRPCESSYTAAFLAAGSVPGQAIPEVVIDGLGDHW